MKTTQTTLIKKIYEVFDSRGFTYVEDNITSINGVKRREYTAPKKELEEAYKEILNSCDSYLKKMLPKYSLDYNYVNRAKCEIAHVGTYRTSIRVYVKEVK